MTLELIIPEIADEKEITTKDAVFSILANGSPKTLTQLHREIKRRHALSVSFQAVIKAIHSLVSHRVLVKEGKLYSFNKDWIFETRKFLDQLYVEFFHVKKPSRKIELGKDITVYTVTNLFELDRLWNDLLMNWAKKEIKDKRNVWKGHHCWWLIPRLQEEDTLHDLFAKNGIQTYNLLTEDTLLDKVAVTYYSKKKEFIQTTKKIDLKTDVHISAFGDCFVKFEIPKEVAEKFERIYQKTKTIEHLDLKKVVDIFKQPMEIEITVMKDKTIADSIKEDIISYFK